MEFHHIEQLKHLYSKFCTGPSLKMMNKPLSQQLIKEISPYPINSCTHLVCAVVERWVDLVVHVMLAQQVENASTKQRGPVKTQGRKIHRLQVQYRCNIQSCTLKFTKPRTCKMIKINTFFNNFLKIADHEKQASLKKKK